MLCSIQQSFIVVLFIVIAAMTSISLLASPIWWAWIICLTVPCLAIPVCLKWKIFPLCHAVYVTVGYMKFFVLYSCLRSIWSIIKINLKLKKVVLFLRDRFNLQTRLFAIKEHQVIKFKKKHCYVKQWKLAQWSHLIQFLFLCCFRA